MRTDNLDDDPLDDFNRRLKRLESGNNLGYSSISEGSLRVASAEGLIVQGSARVSGALIVSGNESVTGALEVSGIQHVTGTLIVDGDLDVNGPTNIAGPTTITGTFQIDGETTINGHTVVNGAMDFTGALNLTGTLTVNGAGKIVVGNLTLDPGGSYGGEISVGGGGVLHLVAATVLASEYLAGDGLSIGALGATILGPLTVFGAKSFGIEHPNKPGIALRHASTESPVSGIEYWGDGTLDRYGDAAIDLPDYFNDLAKPDGRTVFVNGRGHSPDWSDIDGNRFTVSGVPGGRFSWLVKAERFGGDFDVEQPMPSPDN